MQPDDRRALPTQPSSLVPARSCPWCSVDSGKCHEEWCPCSASSRRFIRAQYRISEQAGMLAADRIRAAAETISGGGRV